MIGFGMVPKHSYHKLPASPDRTVSAEDLLNYYKVTKKEVGIYNLQLGKVYYMYYRPLFFGAF